MMMQLLHGNERICGKFPATFIHHYLKYDNAHFSLKITRTTKVVAIRARGSASHCDCPTVYTNNCTFWELTYPGCVGCSPAWVGSWAEGDRRPWNLSLAVAGAANTVATGRRRRLASICQLCARSMRLARAGVSQPVIARRPTSPVAISLRSHSDWHCLAAVPRCAIDTLRRVDFARSRDCQKWSLCVLRCGRRARGS